MSRVVMVFTTRFVQDGTVLDEKDVASLSLVDAVVHHASLAQRPSQTKVESTGGGQQTSSNGERAAEGDTAAGGVKREYSGMEPALKISE